jgi:hypothetical protein
MARKAIHHSNVPSQRKLRKALQTLEETSPQASFADAKLYVCPVCDLPVKPCEADSRAKCFNMLREGTELQALFTFDRETRRQCLSCGKTISKKTLAKNPETELCPACTRKLTKSRTVPLPKGTMT